MAVTTETQERARVSESEKEPSRAEDEPGGPGHSSEPESAPKPSHLFRKVAGGIAVFLLLGIYFVWIGSEMGAHAVAGSTEMWAIFGGIFLGVVAALAGGAMMRGNK